MKFKSDIKFVGANNNFKDSNFLICGIPYDVTSTFRHGSDKGPDSIRYYSDSIETFSYIQEKDLTDLKICDVGNIILKKTRNIFYALKIIENYADYLIKNKKKVIYFGGEHLISLPLIKKYFEIYPNLKVIYLDAHADMREDYNGNKLSHSTVARRIVELIGEKNIFMFGIRSFEKKEYEFIKKNKIFCVDVDNIKKFKKIIKVIKNFPIYISLDLDVFDPCYLLGVGNPEAGGISFKDFVSLLPYISLLKNNIKGIDVVELMPKYDISGSSSVFAAKVIRELIIALS